MGIDSMLKETVAMEKRLLREEFEALVALEKGQKLCEGTDKVLEQLTEKGYVANTAITGAGLAALEPYRVKRAVFFAAGFGSRMVPVTLNTPKPLVRVHGKRIIDTLLDAVVAAGIEEIVIVRGYLGEQFDQLLYKYPNIRFIENPTYNEANNIGSALLAKDLLRNAYVFEADLVLSNPALVQKYHYCSNFLGIPVEHSDDWCFRVENGIIKEQIVGGDNCYQEVGISYWDEEDGAKLEKHIEETFNMPKGNERYWDQVPFLFFPNDYAVEVRPCSFDDIIEIDGYWELVALDSKYMINK